VDKKERFNENIENIEITLKPQCSNCKNNMGKLECKAYGEKPIKYLKNKEVCPNYKDGD